MRGVEVIEQWPKRILSKTHAPRSRWSVDPYREDRNGGRIRVKMNAPSVLRSELAKRTWRHESVALGGITDPYQPLEDTYRLTRGVLEALRDYETPAEIITRSPLVVRDTDVLQSLARIAGVRVSMSIATLSERLARDIEPAIAPPSERLQAVAVLAAAGVRVDVVLAPVLPRLTDSKENIRAVVRAARLAGAHTVRHNALHLHETTREHFFGYARAQRPDLLAHYADTYKGTYAPRVIAEAMDTRLEDALRVVGQMSVPPAIEPLVACQLSLI